MGGEGHEAAAVVAYQALGGAQPEAVLPVLQQAIHERLAQAPLGPKVPHERLWAGLDVAQPSAQYQHYQQSSQRPGRSLSNNIATTQKKELG